MMRVRPLYTVCAYSALCLSAILYLGCDQRNHDVAVVLASAPKESEYEISAGQVVNNFARDKPLAIRPAVGQLVAVSAEEHEWLKRQMQPASTKLTASHCFHVLRAHGLHADFEHPELADGEAVLRLLTDCDAGERYFGEAPFHRTRYGVRFPTNVRETGIRQQDQYEVHRDQCLSALAELGVPLSFPMKAQNGELCSVRDVLRDSVANFHLEQDELAWTALAYALYLPPIKRWQNRFGERFSFDDLAKEILDRPLDEASCGGTHILYSLTILGRADRRHPILSPEVRASLWRFIDKAVHVAVENACDDGAWQLDALTQLISGPDIIARRPAKSVLMTGHIAEWLMYLPEDRQAPEEVLVRATFWLQRQLHELDDDVKYENFCPCTHAVCVVRQMASHPGQATQAVE